MGRGESRVGQTLAYDEGVRAGEVGKGCCSVM